MIDQERKRKEEKRREREVESNGREIWYFEEIRGHEATPSPWHTHREGERALPVSPTSKLCLCATTTRPPSPPEESGRHTRAYMHAHTHTHTDRQTDRQSLIFCTVPFVKQGGARKLFEHNSTSSLKDVGGKEGGKEGG